MSGTFRLLALLTCLAPLAWAQEPVPAPAPPAELAREIVLLISQLGDRSFATREAASARLVQIGRPALVALEAAATSADLEVSQRARRAIDAITGPVKGPEPAEAPAEELGAGAGVLVPFGKVQVIQLGGDGKRLELSREGGAETVKVTQGADTRSYTRKADGSFAVVAGGKTESFKTEAEFKDKLPKQHAEYLEGKAGGGMRLVFEAGAAPLPIPAEARKRIEEATRRLEAIRKEARGHTFHGLRAAHAGEALRAHLQVEGGVLIDAVEGGLAERLGLLRFDLVVAVGEHKVATPDQLRAALDQLHEAKAVELSLIRKGQGLHRRVPLE